MAKVKLVARHNMPEREIKKGDPFTVEKKDAEFLLDNGFAEKPGAAKAKAETAPAKDPEPKDPGPKDAAGSATAEGGAKQPAPAASDDTLAKS